jgi:hypothetical protein
MILGYNCLYFTITGKKGTRVSADAAQRQSRLHGRSRQRIVAYSRPFARDALQKGGWDKVTRLYRGEVPAERCWLHAPGWALA